MEYKCFQTEQTGQSGQTCQDCQYYIPYYLCLNGKFLPAQVGECFSRPLERIPAATPACAKFLPPRKSAPASSPEAAT